MMQVEGEGKASSQEAIAETSWEYPGTHKAILSAGQRGVGRTSKEEQRLRMIMENIKGNAMSDLLSRQDAKPAPTCLPPQR